MGPRIRTVIINATDPTALAGFWAGFLGVAVQETDPGAGIIWLRPDTEGGVNVGLQQVAAKLSTHTETHLDISVDDLDDSQQLIEALGGRLVKANRMENGFEWRVMADVEDNEFCIFRG